MMQPDAPLLTAVAVYERVSSDDQRDRETIKTQTVAIDQYLAAHPEVRVHDRYLDDGVSGSIPLTDRLSRSYRASVRAQAPSTADVTFPSPS